jgi:hypothetical protein
VGTAHLQAASCPPSIAAPTAAILPSIVEPGVRMDSLRGCTVSVGWRRRTVARCQPVAPLRGTVRGADKPGRQDVLCDGQNGKESTFLNRSH